VTYKVEADDVFWHAVDKFADHPDVLWNIYDTLFLLAEHGPDMPGAEPNMWPIGPVLVPGWSAEVLGETGYIGYVSPRR
jgi:hypothetical protein